MDNIFMNSGNSEISNPHILIKLLNFKTIKLKEKQ